MFQNTDPQYVIMDMKFAERLDYRIIGVAKASLRKGCCGKETLVTTKFKIQKVVAIL